MPGAYNGALASGVRVWWKKVRKCHLLSEKTQLRLIFPVGWATMREKEGAPLPGLIVPEEEVGVATRVLSGPSVDRAPPYPVTCRRVLCAHSAAPPDTAPISPDSPMVGDGTVVLHGTPTLVHWVRASYPCGRAVSLSLIVGGIGRLGVVAADPKRPPCSIVPALPRTLWGWRGRGVARYGPSHRSGRRGATGVGAGRGILMIRLIGDVHVGAPVRRRRPYPDCWM
jgi:hypothetical protein